MKIVNKGETEGVIFSTLRSGDCFRRLRHSSHDVYMKTNNIKIGNFHVNGVDLQTGAFISMAENGQVCPLNAEVVLS